MKTYEFKAMVKTNGMNESDVHGIIVDALNKLKMTKGEVTLDVGYTDILEIEGPKDDK